MIGSYRIKIANYFDSLINEIDLKAECLLRKNSGNNERNEEYTNVVRMRLIDEIDKVKQTNLRNLDFMESKLSCETPVNVDKILFANFCFILNSTVVNEYSSESLFGYLIIVDQFVSQCELEILTELFKYANEPKLINENSKIFGLEFYTGQQTLEIKHNLNFDESRYILRIAYDGLFKIKHMILKNASVRSIRPESHFLLAKTTQLTLIFDNDWDSSAIVKTLEVFDAFKENLSVSLNIKNRKPCTTSSDLNKLQRFTFIKSFKYQGCEDDNPLNTLFKFPNLDNAEHLDLSESNIKHVCSFTNLTRLKKLDLSYNRVENFDHGIFRGLSSLEEIDISVNPNADVKPHLFDGLCELKILKMNGLKLKKLDDCTFKRLTKLEQLHLCHNSIEEILPNLFSDLNVLKKLELSDNTISTFDRNSLNGLERLEKLDLSRNLLTLARTLDFSPLKNLSILDISCNKIEEIDQNAFHGLKKLLELSLNRNQIGKIEANSFEDLRQLRILSMCNNQINDDLFADSHLFNGLQNLDKLHLFSNKITVFEAAVFGNLRKLKWLDLSLNSIRRLCCKSADENTQLVNLQVLNLSTNEICDIQAGFFARFPNLRSLNLEANKTGFFAANPNVFQPLSNLETLNLASCEIHQIVANTFANLRSLKHLNLQLNSIQSLPIDSFNGLVNLKTLNLSSNQLDDLKTGVFDGCHKLRYLNLGHNRISVLRVDWFHNLTELEELVLDSNRISAIFSTKTCRLPKLRTLKLSSNELVSVRGDWLRHFASVEHLSLDHNRISCVEVGAFADCCATLSVLELSHNEIGSVDRRVFDGLVELRVLDLSFNRIDMIRAGAYGRSLRNLRVLDLSYNSIVAVYPKAFEGLAGLEYLSLNFNRLSKLRAHWLAPLVSLVQLSVEDNKLKSFNWKRFGRFLVNGTSAI